MQKCVVFFYLCTIMAKGNKENIITEILNELERGINYSDCNALICEKMRIASRTFDNYWKEANIRHKERQEAIQKEIAEQSKEATKERLKTAILSKEQSLQLLSNLAMTAEKDSDKINAVKTISDMEGWKAPTKIEQTNITPLLTNDPISNESNDSTSED